MNHLKLKSVLLAVVLSSATAFAENVAPVYDADNYPPQFDGQPDSEGPLAKPQAETASAMTLSQRIARLEQQLNKSQGGAAPSARVDSLQGEVQSLRAQVEELSHQLQQFQTQQRAAYSDLDKRLMTQQQASVKQIVSAPLPVTTKAPVKQQVAASKPNKPKLPSDHEGSNDQPNVAEEQQIYQTAYNYIKAKKYNDAVTALQSMLKKYPSGQFAANAHYWLGELYSLMNNNAQSVSEFTMVVNNYPDSPKISEAQLKLGMIHMAQSNWPQAKTAFKKVINNYPGTTSARMATEQLAQMKLAGH